MTAGPFSCGLAGNPAISPLHAELLRPEALRPRLTTGLPLGSGLSKTPVAEICKMSRLADVRIRRQVMMRRGIPGGP
jgi:hypothetical protein